MTSKGQQEYELAPIKKGQPYDEDRPRTSSVAAQIFQTLKHKQQNNAEAEKSRRTSRLSKGLNPDVPRPQAPTKSKFLSTQITPRIRRKPMSVVWTTRLKISRAWTSTKFL